MTTSTTTTAPESSSKTKVAMARILPSAAIGILFWGLVAFFLHYELNDDDDTIDIYTDVFNEDGEIFHYIIFCGIHAVLPTVVLAYNYNIRCRNKRLQRNLPEHDCFALSATARFLDAATRIGILTLLCTAALLSILYAFMFAVFLRKNPKRYTASLGVALLGLVSSFYHAWIFDMKPLLHPYENRNHNDEDTVADTIMGEGDGVNDDEISVDDKV